jgi:hypothetical protein
VVEEKLMRHALVHPLVMVGAEGAWGAVLMPLVVLPLAAMLPGSDAGACMENTKDSIAMISGSTWVRLHSASDVHTHTHKHTA